MADDDYNEDLGFALSPYLFITCNLSLARVQSHTHDNQCYYLGVFPLFRPLPPLLFVVI
uniref:Uncharacterized protein n=1 Tax=Rhizophora mucronata TaxID=61149 RepID=A0A2P2K680_RHIMU